MRTGWILSRVPNGGLILDIGFVGERNAFIHVAIRKKYPHRVIVGLDLNERGVRALGLPRTVVGDGFSLPFRDSTFSCVVLAEVLEHVRDPFGFLHETGRVLHVGGRVLITTPNPYGAARWLRHWLFARDLVNAKNIRGFLGHQEHQMLLEPLSLLSLLTQSGLNPTEATTQKFNLPFVGRLIRTRAFEVPVYPFSRLGGYLLVSAVKQAQTVSPQSDRSHEGES